MQFLRIRSISMIVGLLLTTLGQQAAWAQTFLPSEQLTTGFQVLSTLSPVIEEIRGGVVEVWMEEQQAALGLALTEEGLIVTKASEIDTLRPLSVRQGSDRWPVRVVGFSEGFDLALLQAERSGWPLPRWSESGDPAVGQVLITAGPGRVPLAIGVVSVPRREIAKDQIRGILGVQLYADREEAVIESMFDGSAAIAAGLHAGDIISRVDAVAIGSRRELIQEIGRHAPGETVTLEIHRQNETLILPATLTHPFGDFLSRIAQQNRLGGELSRRASGFPAAIQHDSTLKPEQCGGPVVNLDGEIVGVNIARSGRTESLYVPVSAVQEVLQAHRDGKLVPLKSVAPSSPPPPPVPEKMATP